MYKQREEVETAFDSMKNELENGKTNLSDGDAVRGYFFLSFLSLYLYYKILGLLKKNGLCGKVSVREVLLELSKVYEIEFEKRKKLSEIPARAKSLADSLGVDHLLFTAVFLRHYF